jgi:hypothetical protein
MDKAKKVEPQPLNQIDEAGPLYDTELDEAELARVSGGTTSLLLSGAVANVIKSIGEGLSTVARKS